MSASYTCGSSSVPISPSTALGEAPSKSAKAMNMPRRQLLGIALAVDHERRAVEDELVLSTNPIDVDDGQAGFPGPRRHDIAPQRLLPGVIRRTVGHDQYLCTRLLRGTCGSRKPDVLADDDADPDSCHLNHTGFTARREIPLFVEYRIVGQYLLAVDRADAAAARQAGRVVGLPTATGKADEGAGPSRIAAASAELPLACFERRPQQQVFRRISAKRGSGVTSRSAPPRCASHAPAMCAACLRDRRPQSS